MTSPNVGSYNHGTTTVGTTATLIASTMAAGEGGLVIYSSAACFVGGPGVTSSGATQGLPIPATTPVKLPTNGSTQLSLYAITATGTANVSVLFASGS